MDIFSMNTILTKKQMCEQFDISIRSASNILNEIDSEVSNGRYGKHSVIRSGGVSYVNAMVLIDYLTYRTRLKDKNLRKGVPEYNAKEVKEEYCIKNIV